MAQTPKVAVPRTTTYQAYPAYQHNSIQNNLEIQPAVYEVDGEKINLSAEIIRNFLVSGDASIVTDQEILMFMELCKAQKLNPFVRDAYLIKYTKDKPAAVVTSIGAMEKRAAEFPEFDGIESGIIVALPNGQYQKRAGSFYVKGREGLVGGWATVYRKDRSVPTHVTVSLDEYQQRKKDGTLNQNWYSKPAVMIRKCAKATAYREAFPKQNAGLYEADEIRSETGETAPAPSFVPQEVIESNSYPGQIAE